MKADQKVEAPAGGGGSKKLIIIIVAVVLLAAIGGGAAWYFLHGSASEEHSEEEKPTKKKAAKKSGPPSYLPVEAFTVNLQPAEDGTGVDQYLQLAFTLEVGTAEESENIKTNMAKVRSRMLLLLSSKRAAEINTPDGKVQLAKEIVEQLSEPFESRGEKQDIVDVLFTSFIIQ